MKDGFPTKALRTLLDMFPGDFGSLGLTGWRVIEMPPSVGIKDFQVGNAPT